MKKKITFIINPISGGKNKKGFPELIAKYLDTRLFSYEYFFTERPDHANELAIQARNSSSEIVVAVGGDGTINEVASALEGSDCIMGIVPCGSGNGLARSLNISLNNKKALAALNHFNHQQIDSGTLNNYKFFNIGGIGFDAHISNCFANLKFRGFKGYIQTALNEVRQYKPNSYRLDIDGRTIEREAFMISIANSSQYGNNAHISPNASLNDGLLDVVIVEPFPLYHFPAMGLHMFKKTCDKSKYVEIIKGRNIRILSNKPEVIHVDGEPRELTSSVMIDVKPLSLSVLY